MRTSQLCCRLLRLPVAPAVSDQQPQTGRQPLQDANGHHKPPQLLPAPSLRPLQPQASDPALHGNSPTLRSQDAGNITVGSIANAYFPSAPGEGMSTWGRSQHAPEGSQARALGGYPGFGSFQSPAARSPSIDHDHGCSTRTNDMRFASNYMNGIPWGADSALGHPSQQLPKQLQQDTVEPLQGMQRHGLSDMLAAANSTSHALHATLGFQRQVESSSGKNARNSGGSTASSNANSRRGRTSCSGQQAVKAAANSPARRSKHAESAGGRQAQAAARSPPRYHETRFVTTLHPFHDSQLHHLVPVISSTNRMAIRTGSCLHNRAHCCHCLRNNDVGICRHVIHLELQSFDSCFGRHVHASACFRCDICCLMILVSCRAPGALGDSSYDASIRVQRLGHNQLGLPVSASDTAARLPDNTRSNNPPGFNSQQAHRRQAALKQLAARSRSRSTSSFRALSKQPSRTDLDQPHQQQSLLEAALEQDSAAARLAGDYLAAVQSAASIHSAGASSASSWPRQSDVPQLASQQPQQAEEKGRMEKDWEGVLRRGVELAQGPSTDQFLQVVDLYPGPGLGQVTCSGNMLLVCKKFRQSPCSCQHLLRQVIKI